MLEVVTIHCISYPVSDRILIVCLLKPHFGVLGFPFINSITLDLFTSCFNL
jgi:hypothetical protein